MNGATSRLERVLGGSPIGVLARLLVLSVIVGAIMAGLGVTPENLVRHIGDAVRAVFGLGFDAIHDLGGVLMTGAMIVIPIWIVSRLLSRRI